LPVINRDITIRALTQLVKFHEDAKLLFTRYGMDLLSDLGRRNTLLSAAQEKFFTEELKSAGYTVENDGRPGQPDIVVRDEVTGTIAEIECKLTTRNSHGGIVLQTDYETLQRKGSLDYLYVVASPSFAEFCVIYFEGLTADDFRVPAVSSRGKAGMLKHRCYSKSSVLMGEYTSLRELNLEKNTMLLSGRLPNWRRKQCQKSLEHWLKSDDRYRVTLENVSTTP
jgi:hypothetical protein